MRPSPASSADIFHIAETPRQRPVFYGKHDFGHNYAAIALTGPYRYWYDRANPSAGNGVSFEQHRSLADVRAILISAFLLVVSLDVNEVNAKCF